MKQVFFDIDTQIDFMLPAGGLYVPGAEQIIPVVAALNRYAVEHGIPLISTACAHQEDDPEFRVWGPHCVVGTVGQQKPSATLVGQTILEKQELDMFTSPRLPALLEELRADEYVVYGVVTEVCVKFAAEGLLRTGKLVTLVSDAVQSLDGGKRDAFLRNFTAAGGRIAKAVEICK